MNKPIILLFLCVFSNVLGLSLKELDEIFGDVECIEGEFMLQNIDNLQQIQKPSNVLLVKTQDIHLESTKETSLLTEIKSTTQGDKNVLNKINELAQLNKIEIDFLLVEETGDAHEPTFRVRLNLGDEVYQATGRKIKDAKRKAAARALEKTKYLRPVEKTPQENERNVQKLTPTVHLNNIATKLGMKVEYFNEGTENIFIDYSDKYVYYSMDSSKKKLNKFNETTKGLKMKVPDVENTQGGPFRVRVDVGDESFVGTGWTIQSARHDAAEMALEKFRKMSLKDADECIARGELCNKLNLKSSVSLLYELAQKNKQDLDFDVIEESGPAHKKLFKIQCKFGDLKTEGEGSSKKEAKRKPSEAMVKLLEDVQPWQLINVKSSTKSKKKKKNKNKIKRLGAVEQVAMNVLDAFSLDFDTKELVNDDSNQKTEKKGPRSELESLGQEIGVGVRFSSYQDNDQHGSLVSLDTDPGYHCYASERSAQNAEDNAALSALRFLKHVGLNNIMIPLNDPEGKKVIIFDEGLQSLQSTETIEVKES